METVVLIEAVILLMLTLTVLVGAVCMVSILYTLWIERTGLQPPVFRHVHKKKGAHATDDDVPDGFRGLFRMWVDENGKKKLLPLEQVEALEEESRERIRKREDEMAEKYLDGYPMSEVEMTKNG